MADSDVAWAPNKDFPGKPVASETSAKQLSDAMAPSPKPQTALTDADIDAMFTWQPPSTPDVVKMALVSEALKAAAKTILAHCPPCPDRSVAIRAIRDARMNANASIALGGRY